MLVSAVATMYKETYIMSLAEILAEARANAEKKANDPTLVPVSKRYGQLNDWIAKDHIKAQQSYLSQICKSRESNGFCIVHLSDDLTLLPYKNFMSTEVANRIGFQPGDDCESLHFMVAYTQGSTEPVVIDQVDLKLNAS